MKMMKWVMGAVLALGLAMMTGCASKLDPGADATVVRAEQSLSIAYDTIDTFLKLEYDNQELVKEKLPEVHRFAKKLSEPVTVGGKTQPYGISLIQSATDVKDAYKRNRSPENKANLITALASLEALVREAQQHLTAVKSN